MDATSIAVVAEGQDFFNAGLAAMMQTEVGFAKVLRTSDYNGLMKVLARSDAELLVMDYDLPGASGIATIRELRQRWPSMRIAVLSERTDLREVLGILAAGAHGFIPKQISDCAELLRALRSVADTGIFVPASLVEPERWANGHDKEFDSGALANLTDRQQQVVKLLSEGHANKVIARELGISPSTVKVHVHAAFRALGVHSRLAAVAALRPAQRLAADI
ncbi:LuxR C-terminal-related transcriptional regulator [Sphingomonas sp. GCM10030256]|uniref:LuxR C-terminal-related transcriptional regulator n=1 Tax=Sphingomonas sp. GCM10030256 TaxID=3273427 RepID=UPI00361AE09B